MILLGAGLDGCNRAGRPSDGEKASATGPILIGHFGSMTGTEATFGDSTDKAIQLAIEEANARGGVKGKQVKLKTYDNQGKPEESLELLGNWLDAHRQSAEGGSMYGHVQWHLALAEWQLGLTEQAWQRYERHSAPETTHCGPVLTLADCGGFLLREYLRTGATRPVSAAVTEDRHDLQQRQGFLERFFDWSQRLWWLIVPAMLAVLVWGTYFVYRDKVLTGSFWHFPDQEELFLDLEMPAGTDIRLATETLRLFEDAIAPVEDGVRMRSTTFDYRGFIRVEFDKALVTTTVPSFYREVWVVLADRTGGVSIFIRGFADQPYFKGPFTGSSLNSLVKVTGYNSKQLNRIADNTLRTIQMLRRVRNARLTSGLQWGDRSTQD